MGEKEKILNKFLVSSNLEKLESKLNTFNPFKVLKINEYEIRHSNFLAWLFNPKENHGLGDLFLKKFLSALSIDNNLGFSIMDIKTMNLSKVIVFREHANIDILIVCDDGTNKFVVIIENKVKSKESQFQLQKYINHVRKEYPTYNLIPIFLTLYGDEASSEEYFNMDYETIYSIIEIILQLKGESLHPKVYDFINQYLKILEVFLMKNEEISKLCKEIYKEHKEAIELIEEYSGGNFEETITTFFDKNQDMEKLNSSTSWFWFLPKELIKKLPTDLMQNWQSPYPIAFFFYILQGYNKIRFIIEVGPFKDGIKRSKFLEYLKNKGIEIKDSSMAVEARYTRIFSKSINYTDWEDTEKLSKDILDLFNKEECQDKFKEVSKIVEEYNFNQ